MHRIRDGAAEDRGFVVEMARFACTLEDRPLPDPDATEVLACLPIEMSVAVTPPTISSARSEPRGGTYTNHRSS
jgi:hypothetical protein